MMTTGIAVAAIWNAVLKFSGSIYEVLPGMLAGFAVYLVAWLWGKEVRSQIPRNPTVIHPSAKLKQHSHVQQQLVENLQKITTILECIEYTHQRLHPDNGPIGASGQKQQKTPH
jgi:hypothetical protein